MFNKGSSAVYVNHCSKNKKNKKYGSVSDFGHMASIIMWYMVVGRSEYYTTGIVFTLTPTHIVEIVVWRDPSTPGIICQESRPGLTSLH